MPEEILYFIIRLLVLGLVAGFIWLALTQIVVPLLFKRPIFPLINRTSNGSVLADIRAWQRETLKEELEDKKHEVELTRLEVEIEETKHKIDEEKAKLGDNTKK